MPDTPSNLIGVRIWLSGSLPEEHLSSVAERTSIMAFVRQFAQLVFRSGGQIIHGAHPSFTPTLLAEATNYQQQGGRRDCLVLVASRFFTKDSMDAQILEWRQTCTVYETPEVCGDSARDESLALMRSWIAARCDAFVAVGGQWHTSIAGRSGLPIEANLALERSLPCFLLGGLGGASAEFIRTHRDVLTRLRNGMTIDANLSLARETEISRLAPQICEQLDRLPLVCGRVCDGYSFRILALDGGGIKGTFTAAVLAAWEQHTGSRIIDHFDLIAGTSTGGILAIGLGLGLSAAEMLEFYRKRGPVIFPVTSVAQKWRHTILHLLQPKYSQQVLLRELRTAFQSKNGSIRFNDSQCRLVIPAYHAIAGAVHVFRTPHHPLLTADSDTDMTCAALATAAAPTYFSAATVRNLIAEGCYFDGGVWANCPSLAAIVEATCYLGVSLDRIDLLSVGTTEEPCTFRKQRSSGIFGWNIKLIELFMNAQAEGALNHSKLLVGQPRFERVNITTKPGSYKLDSPAEIEELADLGSRRGYDPETLAQIRSRFLNGVPVLPWKAHS